MANRFLVSLLAFLAGGGLSFHNLPVESYRDIVIVGGLMAAVVLAGYLLPTLYAWVAGEHEVLPVE